MTDQRQSARKIVKVKAVIAMEGQAPMPGRTSDIGSNGVSIAVAHPLQVGQTGQVGFDLLVEGKLASIMARAKVIYCIFSGGGVQSRLPVSEPGPERHGPAFALSALTFCVKYDKRRAPQGPRRFVYQAI